MSRTLSATFTVNARFTVKLHDVPEDATLEQIKEIASTRFGIALDNIYAPNLAETWDEELVSVQTPGGKLIFEK